MNQFFWQEVIPNWLTAIGTVGAVVVALFQKPFSRWFNRPKIKVNCINQVPYTEVIAINTDSSSKENELKIRVKVENEGKSSANHCIVNVDCYYEKRKNEESYVKKEFAPILLRDYRNATPATIAPHLIYYLDVAAIRKTDQMSASDESSQFHQFYKLFIMGDKKPIELGKGTFIIPIKISAAYIKSSINYLKVYWDSDSFVINKQCFSITLISNKDFKGLTII